MDFERIGAYAKRLGEVGTTRLEDGRVLLGGGMYIRELREFGGDFLLVAGDFSELGKDEELSTIWNKYLSMPTLPLFWTPKVIENWTTERNDIKAVDMQLFRGFGWRHVWVKRKVVKLFIEKYKDRHKYCFELIIDAGVVKISMHHQSGPLVVALINAHEMEEI